MNQNVSDEVKFKASDIIYIVSIFMFLYPFVLATPHLISLMITAVKPDIGTIYLTFWYIFSYSWIIGLFIFVIGLLVSSKIKINKNIIFLLIEGVLVLIAPFIGKWILINNSSYLLYGLLIFIIFPGVFSGHLSYYIILNKKFVIENRKEIFVSLITFILGNFTLAKSIASIL